MAIPAYHASSLYYHGSAGYMIIFIHVGRIFIVKIVPSIRFVTKNSPFFLFVEFFQLHGLLKIEFLFILMFSTSWKWEDSQWRPLRFEFHLSAALCEHFRIYFSAENDVREGVSVVAINWGHMGPHRDSWCIKKKNFRFKRHSRQNGAPEQGAGNRPYLLSGVITRL